ncbi:unnamed protein product [Cuscuta epithymum]|uniref:Uncharacterized protein n=1 Tax=Cuscuta epithymum TaxID=186058 RepID=A0AAV0DUU0_9ASTE|nr:unnamed protein product [Cuscuta epithymum]
MDAIAELPPLGYDVLNDILPPRIAAIPENQIPSAENVVQSMNHLTSLLQLYRMKQNIVSNVELANSIAHNHSVVTKYSQPQTPNMQTFIAEFRRMSERHEGMLIQIMNGQTEFKQQMHDAVNDKMNQLKEALVGQFSEQLVNIREEIQVLAAEINAEINAGRARAFNSTRIDHLKPVCKIKRGHPSVLPPPNHPFALQSYPVGSLPPNNLIPINANDIAHLTHEQMDFVFWFYNEPELARGANNLVQRHDLLQSYLRA